ncbi:hypothetical protein RND81_05G031500 [Saponaria officinalis]|uniref:Uncharacterized protein n=1 Tax=Saponaria officinalis TaxID=3572 RepID=A0AAW1KX87_SAPOF
MRVCHVNQLDTNLGAIRSCFAAIGASNKGSIPNVKYVLENPKFRRFFFIETPKKKNYENFYSKEKKEILKANEGSEQKSESKGLRKSHIATV